MDSRSIDRLLGEIHGKLESLLDEFHDEREQARAERKSLFEKIGQQDVIRAELDTLKHKVDGMRTQIYSNKSEIDTIKNQRETESKVSLNTAKMVALFGTVLAFVATVLWNAGSYLSAHWNEVAAFLKGKP